MSLQLAFWTAVVAPLALPLCAPGLRWLAVIAATLFAGIVAGACCAPADIRSPFLFLCALAALLAGIALRIMLSFVRRLTSGG